MSRQCSGCESVQECRELEDFKTLKDRFVKELGDRDNGLSNGLKADTLVKYSCALGRHLVAERLKTSQVRRFLDSFRKENSSLRRQPDGKLARRKALLLEPRLAYAAGRQPYAVGPLFEILRPAIQRVREEKDDFDILTRFLESVVAYHKYHGGRD